MFFVCLAEAWCNPGLGSLTTLFTLYINDLPSVLSTCNTCPLLCPVKAIAKKLSSSWLCFMPSADERSTQLHPHAWRPRRSRAPQWPPRGDGNVATGDVCWRRGRCPLRCLLSCRWTSPGQHLLTASTGRSLAFLTSSLVLWHSGIWAVTVRELRR